jgi:hypothetical protein
MQSDSTARYSLIRGQFIQARRKGSRDKGELAGHGSLDEIHGDDEVGDVQRPTVMGIRQIPAKDT